MPMTRLQVIDHVEEFLVKQGRPAISEDGACVYRDEAGRNCAIGCLPGFFEAVPDWYHNTLATTLFDGVPAFKALFASDVTKVFIEQVQLNLHDSLVRSPEFSRDVTRNAVWLRTELRTEQPTQ